MEATEVVKDDKVDKLKLIVGKWHKIDGDNWHFEPDGSTDELMVRLYDGLDFSELARQVRAAANKSVFTPMKITYKFPEWLTLDEGEGDAPQFITCDSDLVVFICLRRSLEDMKLFVTFKKPVLWKPRDTLLKEKTVLNGEGISSTESEKDWVDITIAESLQRRGIARSLLDEFNKVAENRQSTNVDIPQHCSHEVYIGCRREVATEQEMDDTASSKGKHTMSIDDTLNETPHKDAELRMVSRNGQSIPSSAFSLPENHVIYNGAGPSKLKPIKKKRPLVPIDELEILEFNPTNITVWGGAEEALTRILEDNTENSPLFMRDAPPVFNSVTNENIDTALFDISYEGDKVFTGRVFKSKEDCRIKVAIHAINQKYHFVAPRSTPEYMVLKCVCKTCPWRVYAHVVDDFKSFQIRKVNLTHTCTIEDRRQYHRLATTQVIGELLASRYIGIKKGPTPAAIRKILLDDYNVQVSYWKAWRGREVAMDIAHGTVAGSYVLLPQYLALLEIANPGTISAIEHNYLPGGKRQFKYCFLSFAASIAGFQWVRKVIVVDGTHLKARYGGVLVSACCQDANFQIFPLAYGIVDSENDASWEWFFKKLNTFVPDSHDLVFISDRHASIYTGLRKVYKSAHHGACTVHLYRNVEKNFKPERLADMMSRAARCYTIDEFNKRFAEIQNLNSDCADYLYDIGFEHWTRSHFQGKRYNIMDTNIAESWNNVLNEAREYPLICMLEYIRIHLMTWFAVRREKAHREISKTTPEVRSRIEESFERSTSMVVRPISIVEYEVQEKNGASYIVNMGPFSCTCREVDIIGLPCGHSFACAALMSLPTDVMMDDYYMLSSWVNTYAAKLYPIPAVAGEPLGGLYSSEPSDTLPPKRRRPSGRPRVLRIRSSIEFKRQGDRPRNKCSKCFREGHNKASCRYGM